MKKLILFTITTLLLLFNCSNEPCKDENCITNEQFNFFNKHIPNIVNKKVLFEMSSMDLSSKEITSLPAGIFNNLINLTSVDLTDNPICNVDKGDIGLAETVTLTLTPLNENCLTDDQLTFFSSHIASIRTKQELYEATTLDLSNKSITSFDTGIFNNLTNLTSVDLTDNDICIVDKADVGLDNGVTLTFGNYCSEVTDEQLTFFSSHILSLDTKKKLYDAPTLDLSSKSISTLPTGIFNNLTNLTDLDLYNNNLTSIPAEIGNLTSLTDLRLYNNELASIPAEIGNLTSLTDLRLYNNELASIPAEIGNLTSLTWLDLHSNKLASIPAGIGNLTNLTFLDLHSNKLASIPAGIFTNLTNLTVLRLFNNNLTSLPDGIFDNLTSLTQLQLRILSSDTNMLTCDRDNFDNWGLPDPITIASFWCNN